MITLRCDKCDSIFDEVYDDPNIIIKFGCGNLIELKYRVNHLDESEFKHLCPDCLPSKQDSP